MTIVAQDTFTRADTTGSTTISNAAGWGTSSDGEAWSTLPTTSCTFKIVSNRGQESGDTGRDHVRLGTQTLADAEALVRFSVSNIANYFGLTLRQTDTSNWYAARYNNGKLDLEKDVTGTATQITNTTFTITANTLYWLRFRCQGTNLKAKIWADGSSEPGSWTLTTTDSALTSAAGFGFVWNNPSSSDVIKVDSYSVDNLVAHVLISDGYGGVFT